MNEKKTLSLYLIVYDYVYVYFAYNCVRHCCKRDLKCHGLYNPGT